MSLPDKPGILSAPIISAKVDEEIAKIVNEINHAEYGKRSFYFEYRDYDLAKLIYGRLRSVINFPKITYGESSEYDHYAFIRIEY